jgi:hypothetical protein
VIEAHPQRASLHFNLYAEDWQRRQVKDKQ